MSLKPNQPSKQVAVRAGAPPPAADQPPRLDVGALLEKERAQQVQAELEASLAAYDDLAAQHHHLQEQLRKQERDGYELAELFRREMLAKNEQVAGLQQEVAREAHRLQEAQATADAREAQLQAAFEAERQQMAAQSAALQEQLDSVAAFQQAMEGMEAELQQLRREVKRIGEEAGEKVRALQRRLYELENPAGSCIGAADGGAGDDEDDDLCMADMHRLLAHSRKVEGEMKLYGQEAEELQREMRALEAERAALLRDVALREEMEQQYAKRGSTQARQIHDAHTKISSLERGLAQMAADFEEEKAALEEQLRQQLAAAQAEQTTLRRLLQARPKELQEVRRLAQEVLLQRTDVEAFLVSSIQQVRAEMAAAAAATAGGQPEGHRQLHLPQRQQSLRQDSSSFLQPASSSMAVGSSRPAAAVDTVAQRPPSALPSAASMPFPCTAGTAAEGSAAPCTDVSSRIAAAPDSASISASGVSAMSISSKGGVDLRDLRWEDRERILRLLFAKINKAAQQRSAAPTAARSQALSAVQSEAFAVPLRGMATEAGPADLA